MRTRLTSPDDQHRGTQRLAVLAAMAWAAALIVAPSAQTRTLRLVSTPWSPFTNAPDRPRFALDLVDEALRRQGIVVESSIVDETQLNSAVLGGRFDGSAALWRDEARERVLRFSAPYLENRLILVGRRDSDVSASSLADLTGRRVALVAGYSYGDEVDRTSGPGWVRVGGLDDAVARLLAGEVDYTLMDELVVQYLIAGYPEQARTRLAFGARPLVTRTLHLAVRRSLPDAAAIIDRFNATLHDMIADGSYHRLLHVDWVNVDIDGDSRPEYVPYAAQAGPTPPTSGYAIFLPPVEGPPPGRAAAPRFYFGGVVYEDWASVPERYKIQDPNRPAPSRALVPLITFRF